MKTTKLLPSLNRLSLRQIKADELEKFNYLLVEHHYLHSSKSAGETLRYVAEIDGKWVALLLWGSAAYRLKPRDEWIGWDSSQRHSRLKLVVQNRRFLILPEIDMPNLASKTLAMCLKQLPDDWYRAFGYKPLLAETFVDPALHQGTCYKASGWETRGFSAGFGRDSMDFYQAHDRPKQLWTRPLHKRARELLRTREALPEAFRNAEKDSDNAHSINLNVPQMEGLWKRFNEIEDFRRKQGKRYRLATVLSLLVLGTLCGKQNLKAIVNLAAALSQIQLRSLRSWKNPRTGVYHAPCYSVFYDVLQNVDGDKFDEVVSAFICEQDGHLPRDIAVDGKVVRGTCSKNGKQLNLVAAVDHEQVQMLAQVATDDKSNEIPAVQELLQKMPPMPESTFTFDAMHTQLKTANMVVEELGADYIMQLKDNQPGMLQYAQGLFQPPFSQP